VSATARLRFAPSPTGHLHVGNARTALFNWLFARGSGGTFVLRIEDTDAERSTRESEASILEDLRWLGLHWDEGPGGAGAHGPYRQSERALLYRGQAERLLDAGAAYRCFCTPEQLEAERRAALAQGAPVRYSGRCRDLPREEVERRLESGEPAAVRFRVGGSPEVVFEDVVRGTVRFRTESIGDPAILRPDGSPAYNFAVVVDDALMRITHVIRGEDHISNTPRQILLHRALGFEPPVFAHLALVMGPDHSPLSKRHGATSVSEFRSRGYLPEAMVNYLALLGWSPRGRAAEGPVLDEAELVPLAELARRFSLDAVGHSPGVFDEAKLAWVNRHYLKAADAGRLAGLSVEFLRRAGVDATPDDDGLAYLASIVPIATGSVDRLDQVPARLSCLFTFDAAAALAQPGVADELAAGAARVVTAWEESVRAAPRLDRERFRAIAADVRAKTGQKGRALFHPIRLAVTGQTDGPELDLLVPAIDRGADLPTAAGLPAILGCRERAALFVRAMTRG
jgi:glutamyl-tRNA synthetase/nondiscriminating glutamyl-tRNA synthetase